MSEPRDKLDISDLKDTFLECPVCVEHFNKTDRCPRLLQSCLHVFCTQCLRQLLIKEGKGQITCPLCRNVQKVKGQVDTITVDPVRGRLVEYVQIKHQKDIKCSDCPDNNPAVERCSECAMNMCSECVRAHRRTRLTKDHSLTSLEKMAQEGFKTYTAGHFCSIHPKHQVEFYCTSCDNLCCLSCTVVDHKGHGFEPIPQAASSKVMEWEPQASYVAGLVAQMKYVCDGASKETERLACLESESLASIHQVFSNLFNQLNKKKESLIEEVKRQSSEAIQVVTKQKESTEDRIAVAESVTGYFHQMKTRASDFEILKAAPALQNSLTALCEQDTVSEIISEDIYKFVALSDDVTNKVLQAAGKIEISKGQRKREGGTWNTKRFSIQSQTPPKKKAGPWFSEFDYGGQDTTKSSTMDAVSPKDFGAIVGTRYFEGIETIQLQPVDGQIYSFALPAGIQVNVYHGDVAKAKTGGIVNASDSELQNKAGIARAVERACGNTMKRECKGYIRQNGPLNISEVMHTRAGELQGVSHVLHTVGPVYDPNLGQKCGEYLTMTFLRCLDHARSIHLQSLTFPFIGTGVDGVPVDMCVESFLDAAVMFSHSHQSDPVLMEIHLVNTDLEMVQTAIVMIKQHLEEGFDTLVAKAMTRLQNKCEQGYRNERRLRSESKRERSSSIRRSSSFSQYTGYRSFEEGDINKVDVDAYTLHRRRSGSFVAAEPSTSKRRNSAGKTRPDDKYRMNQNSNVSNMFSSLNKRFGSDEDVYAKDKHDSDKWLYHSSSQASIAQTLPIFQKYEVKNTCSFCLDPILQPFRLVTCGHVLCKECHSQVLKSLPQCPVCGQWYGSVTGPQPEGGTMNVKFTVDRNVPGYKDAKGVIVIDYSFPGGKQKAHHLNPGKAYSGTQRTAYLPNNQEGQVVLNLLKKSFNAGMTFTIGKSQTSGKDGVITWSSIEHKTSLTGGPASYGYPDTDYLTRVKQQLADVGITR